ncbi:MAG: hypothetical protein ABIS23_04500 [Sphingomicrobium sp.]
MRNILLAGTALIATAMIGGSATAAPGQNSAQKPTQPNRVETRAEVTGGVAKMFTKLDTNKDGFVTQAEIDAKAGARQQNMAAKADKAKNYDPAKMFGRLDSNKDGKVTKAEADAAMATRAAAKGKPGEKAGARSANLFGRADANKDGVLTLAEVSASPKSARGGGKAAAGKGAQGGRMAQMLGSADLNKDGKISQAEVQTAALQRFDRVDANRDGKVTVDERKAARQQRKPS